MEEREGMKELEKRKKELIERAKHKDRAIYGRDCEIKALESVLRAKSRPPTPGRLRAEVERLEFQIATEAYTLDHELELLKKIKTKKALLEEAVEFARKGGRLRRLGEELAVLRKEREGIEAEIQDVKKEIIAMRRTEERRVFDQERKRKRTERDSERKRETEKYMGKTKDLELGDIAVIRKKGGGQE